MLEKLTMVSGKRNEKINKIEELKSLHSPLDSFKQFEEYAKTGAHVIPDHDKAFFLKSFGIFQMSAGSEEFMIRLRIPGGRLSVEQGQRIGQIAKSHGKNYIDITSRMQIQLRYINIKEVPFVLKSLEEVGITSYQTGVDNFRNIMCDPLDGKGFDCVINTQGIGASLEELFIKQEEWICTIPRKFNIAISGSYANRCNVFGQDVGFALAQKDGMYGFNVYLGGKVGKTAQYGSVFLKDREEIVLFLKTLAQIYKDYGFKDNRAKNRLKFLIDEVGMESFIGSIKELAGYIFSTGGNTLMDLEGGDVAGVIELKDGTFALFMAVPGGVFTGTHMIETSEIAQKYGDGNISLTAEQNIYITGVKKDNIEAVLSMPVYKTYKNSHTPYYNNILTCTGSKFCSFGLIDTKSMAIDVAQHLSDNMPLENGKLRMYWSGCKNGCGIPGAGDIGFVGTNYIDSQGKVNPGVNILVGGSITGYPAEGNIVLKATPVLDVKKQVENIISIYLQNREYEESFEKFYKRKGSLLHTITT